MRPRCRMCTKRAGVAVYCLLSLLPRNLLCKLRRDGSFLTSSASSSTSISSIDHNSNPSAFSSTSHQWRRILWDLRDTLCRVLSSVLAATAPRLQSILDNFSAIFRPPIVFGTRYLHTTTRASLHTTSRYYCDSFLALATSPS